MKSPAKLYLAMLAMLALSPWVTPAMAEDQAPALPVLTLDPGQANIFPSSLPPTSSTPSVSPSTLTLDQATTTPVWTDDSNAWRFSLAFYLWAPGINGKLGVLGHTTSIDQSFTDIYQETDSLIGLSGRLEVAKEKWTLYADGTFMQIAVDNRGADTTGGKVSVDVKMDIGIATSGLYYRLGEWKFDESKLTLDIGPAARYMYLGLSFTGHGVVGINWEDNQNWIDALAAGQMKYDIDRHWQLLVRGDVGAGMSDYTWMAGGFASYRFQFNDKLNGTLSLGYQAIGDKYTDGGFTYDAILHGPVFLFGIDF